MSIRSVISISIAIVVGVILFTVVQEVLDGQTTTTWSALSITLAFLLPSVLLIILAVGAFMKITSGGR
jgi:methyl coenzyme M reductase alpha subunit